MYKRQDLSNGISLHIEKESSVVSVTKQKRFIWRQKKNSVSEPVNYNIFNRPRRQDFSGFLVENGAFYITSRKKLLKSKNRISGDIITFEMDEKSYFEIDELSDWVIVEQFLRNRNLDKVSSFKYKDKIKLFLSDVDGVLTDAGMYYSELGDELKKFNTHDGMGFQLLRESGIRTGIVTSEITELVRRRARKLEIDHLFQGEKYGGKLHVVEKLCKELSINLDNVAYVGDDLNCKQLLEKVGLAACPHNAVSTIKQIPGIKILERNGGQGVVREFVEFLLGV